MAQSSVFIDREKVYRMDQETQATLTEEILFNIDHKITALKDNVTRNPVSAYTDPERLKREQNVLFRKYPIFMGFSCQLPDQRSFITEDRLGIPIVIVRGDDHIVRAFFNVCRHRGAKLAKGCGHLKKNLVCPYHGWVYDSMGKLIGIPDRPSFNEVDFEDNGLVELPAQEIGGLIWVLPTPGAKMDVEEHLAGLAPELENYEFQNYHHYENRILNHKINWKMAIDTFLEPYHFGVLHSKTLTPIFFPNVCLFHPFGLNLRETLPRRSIMDLRNKPREEWDLITHSAIVYVLFPNTVFVMQADHAEFWRIFPVKDNVDESLICLDFYIPRAIENEQTRRHWERNMDLVLKTVEEEDFPTVEGIQFGFSAGAQESIVYGRNEPALVHFEHSVVRALENAQNSDEKAV